jgi:lipoprotein-anchoring transpeptidase ErfK/SrfK
MRIIYKIKLLTVVLGVLAIASCVPGEQAPASSPGSNLPANNAPATSSNPAPQPPPNAASMPVTLPLIDAMFEDESFAADLKSQLQLTDEQVQKVQDAARDAVLGLNEEGDGNRSTTAATKKAQETIREAIGPEKTEQLFNLVRTRWAGTGGEALTTAKPNQVPTDTRIVVNAPAYRMDIFVDGQLKKSYEVGIGYPEFPLPTGLRKAKEIIFNPTWTPPDEPWVKGKFSPGKKVEAGSKLNPLGPIKIPIGLPSLIHGGKDPNRLGTFASHGCVGLTDAGIRDFTMELSAISGQPISMDQINAYGKDKAETKDVKLQNEVPVELRYETIVVENGKLKIYRDVYERGTNTEENLRKVFDAYEVSFDSLPANERTAILEGLRKMAYDATGQPVDPENSPDSKNSKSSKVTRNIKGEKMVEFDVPALSGKGYPAPIPAKP